jgi:Probable sensor domain DACNV
MSAPMTEAYPAARAVAPRIQEHFVRHLRAAREHGWQPAASLPDPPGIAAIEAIINAAFWASLRREEGYIPRISLALVAPEDCPAPLVFERPLPLGSGALARVAPAVERAGIHLGVWWTGGELNVWGTMRAMPAFVFVAEVAAPGLIVIKHQRAAGDAGKFVNIAVLEGDQIKIIDERASALGDCPTLVSSLLGAETPGAWGSPANVLVQVAVSMRSHARGGILLIVPQASDGWRESVVRPMPYAVSPPFSALAHLMTAAPGEHAHLWFEAVGRAVDAVAGLTAVDGATVMTDQYQVLAFGVKIARRDSAPQVERVTATEPIEGGIASFVHPTFLGGTRHLSAAQFVQDQRDAVALVASQDGRFTIFAWSPSERMVHAHRVEALLL